MLTYEELIKTEEYKVTRATAEYYNKHPDANPMDAFIAAAQWRKEQMMKDAVEYDVDGCGYLIPKDKGGVLVAYPFDEYFPSKVKLIIVKED